MMNINISLGLARTRTVYAFTDRVLPYYLLFRPHRPVNCLKMQIRNVERVECRVCYAIHRLYNKHEPRDKPCAIVRISSRYRSLTVSQSTATSVNFCFSCNACIPSLTSITHNTINPTLTNNDVIQHTVRSGPRSCNEECPKNARVQVG